MTEYAERAIDRVRDEMAEKPNDAGVQAIGTAVTAFLIEEPDAEACGKIADEKKTLSGAFDALRDYARKHADKGFYYAGDNALREAVFAGYYGIAAHACQAVGACSTPCAPTSVEAEPAAPDVADKLDALFGGIY